MTYVQQLVRTAIFIYCLLITFLIMLKKFMYICIWKRMKQMDDNLIVTISNVWATFMRWYIILGMLDYVTFDHNLFFSIWISFGVHMLDINSEQQPTCTQFEIEMDWETLIQSKDKPIPYQILLFGIIFSTLVFVIAVKVRRKKISLVMPLNQPRDFASIFLAGYFMILWLLLYIIKHK